MGRYRKEFVETLREMKTPALLGIILFLLIELARVHYRPVHVVFHERPNGDYTVKLYGKDRALVCEEKDITIVSQGDAISPVVLDCSHTY